MIPSFLNEPFTTVIIVNVQNVQKFLNLYFQGGESEANKFQVTKIEMIPKS